jgi:ABC-2 type transport system permease protein
VAELSSLLLRGTLTRGRLVGLSMTGVLVLFVAVAILIGDGGAAAAVVLVEEAGLALVVPVVAAVIATGVLGDAAEDGTLAHLLLTPRPRVRLATAAVSGAMIAAVVLTVPPLVVAVLVNGVSIRTVAAVAVATVAASCAYAAVFTALGLRVRRALIVGLVYIAVWETTLSRVADTAARLSLRQYATSLLAGLRGQPPPDRGVTALVAGVTLGVVVVAAVGLTTRWLERTEVR